MWPCSRLRPYAVVGAMSSYGEKYLTTSVGQWVTHDLRRTLYHHINRLSLSQHDESRTGDMISRVTSDIEAIQSFITSAMLGIVVDVFTLDRHGGGDVHHKLAVYVDRAFRGAAAVRRGLFLYAQNQESLRERCEKKKASSSPSCRRCFRPFASCRPLPAKITNRNVSRDAALNPWRSLCTPASMKAKLAPIVDVIVAVGTCLVLGYGAESCSQAGCPRVHWWCLFCI